MQTSSIASMRVCLTLFSLSLMLMRAKSEGLCVRTTSSATTLADKVAHLNQQVTLLDKGVTKIYTEATTTLQALESAHSELESNNGYESTSLSFQLRTKSTECTEEQDCSLCTNGSLVLRCVDGLLHYKELRFCEELGLPLPRLLSLGARRIQQDTLQEEYLLDNIVSCCFFQDTITDCTCKEGFAGESFCSSCSHGYGGENCTACPTASDGSVCAGHGVCTNEGTCACFEGFAGEDCSSCKKGFGGPSCLRCDQSRLVFEGETFASCCPSSFECSCENSSRGCDATPAPIEQVKACLTSPPHSCAFAGSSQEIGPSNISYFIFSHPSERTWLDTYFRVFQCGGQLAWTLNAAEYTAVKALVRGGDRHGWTGGRLRSGYSFASDEGWGWIDFGGTIWDVVDPSLFLDWPPRDKGSTYVKNQYDVDGGYWAGNDAMTALSFVLETGRKRFCHEGYYGDRCLPCPGLISTGLVCSGHGECSSDDGYCFCSFGYGGDDCNNTSLLEFLNCSDGNYTYVNNTSAIRLSSGVIFHLLQHKTLSTWSDQVSAAEACGGKIAWTIDREELDAAKTIVNNVADSWVGGAHNGSGSFSDKRSWKWISTIGDIEEPIEETLWNDERPVQGGYTYIAGNPSVSGLLDIADGSTSYVVVEFGRRK